MISKDDVTGVILAGGRGSRMGGADKGLQNFRGMPMAMFTLLRLAPQVGDMMINANRNLAAYESFGVPVWPDVLADYAGPLAGFLTGLEHCETGYLVTVPCDTPLFPQDLVQRLAEALVRDDADIAMAAAREADPGSESGAGSQVRAQPVFSLLKRELMESLVRFTQGGGRKIDAWTAEHRTVLVEFEDAAAFSNANTVAELHRLEQQR
ncbi:molybdenum cofactor guanylyltransferase MobA [Ramlibacter sp. USB13]|uniref:Molybdenum cofactor guanylyltransferase n=1 Tax=Ramlibacter cellulosilyticus TaxID=2764187 RepID=A0A923SB20_9BURK|nr:molybdenum cofactor guanylyltransferase MobA [Ramlibacter cellulosilyticus]MBC5783386.1 molybdenum cofactor guanylyltransferase MobA [Ramlibacter cellulosilyticus]